MYTCDRACIVFAYVACACANACEDVKFSEMGAQIPVCWYVWTMKFASGAGSVFVHYLL